MDERINNQKPEEQPEQSNEREKELSGQFEDPGMDFLFADE